MLLLVLLRQALGLLLYRLAHLILLFGPSGRAAARPLLAGAIRLQPDNRRARAYYDHSQALRLFPRGETAEALKLLKRAHRAVPDDEIVHLDWGIALTMAGHYDQAIGVLEQLGKDGERAVHEQQLWSALGWAYLRTGRLPLAQTTAKQATEYGVATPEMQLIMSLSLLGEQGWIDKATIRGILGKRPHCLGMVLEFAFCLAQLGKRTEAQKLVKALPEGMQPRAWRIIARHSLNEDDAATAQWALTQFSGPEPDPAASILLVCEVAARDGSLAGAVASAHRATADRPDDAEVLAAAGRVMVLAGEREKAFQYMTTALANGSRDALAGGVVALHLLERGQVEDAKSVFAIQRTGDELACVYAHTATAWLLQARDELAEAVALAARACDMWDELPAWMATEAVRTEIIPRLIDVAESAEIAADESTRRQAAAVLARLAGPDAAGRSFSADSEV